MNEIIGVVTIILAIGTFVPYLRDVIKGKIKPHPFTWFIWSTLFAIAFSAQISDNAGPGAWMNGVVVLICWLIVIFSLKHGLKDIAKMDYVVLGICITAIICWWLTNNPLTAVILILTADIISTFPIFRKFYNKPYDEALYLYMINGCRHGISLFALANFSLVTSFFPIFMVVSNFIISAFLIWRRRAVSKP